MEQGGINLSWFQTNLVDWTGYTNFPDLENKLRNEGGWGRPDYLASLYTYVKRLLHPALIVEIGCYRGESTVVMGHAIRGTKSHIVTIDPAYHPEGADYPDVHHGDLYQNLSWWALMENIKRQKLEGYITLVPDYSHNVLQRWDGRAIDMLFIDGSHSYESVLKDCEWMAHVKPGGICAVDDWFAEIEAGVRDSISDKPQWHILHESTHEKTGDYCVTLLQKDV